MFKEMLRRQNLYVEIAIFFAGFILIVAVLQVFPFQRLLFAFLLPLLLIGVHYHKRLGTNWLIMLEGTHLGVIAWNTFKIYRMISYNFINPPEWDFLAFWLDGNIASRQLNFYIPSNYLGFDLPVGVSQEFSRSILEVGFRYPPPTMLLFLPLGWFDSYYSAYLGWQIFMAAILLLNIVLLWKLFLDKSHILGLLASGALVLSLPPTYVTFYFAQTNFLVLLALLLLLMYPDRFAGGVWLGIGMAVKPFIGLLFLFSAIQHRSQVVAGSIITYGLLSILFIALFGITTFTSYFSEQPTLKMPEYVYSEPVNQSLLAQILRLTGNDLSGVSPLFNPIFIAITVFLLTITGVLAFLLKNDDMIWAFVLTLLTALLVYPKTLSHYSILLVIPMFVLWKYRNRWIGGVWASVFIITLTYIIFLSNWNYAFLVTLLYWFVFVAFSTGIALVRSGRLGQIGHLPNGYQGGGFYDKN